MKGIVILTGLVFLVGCASQEYWVRQGTNIRATAADLEACRLAANNGGEKVFTAAELERPCMIAKGYNLSNSPPTTE